MAAADGATRRVEALVLRYSGKYASAPRRARQDPPPKSSDVSHLLRASEHERPRGLQRGWSDRQRKTWTVGRQSLRPFASRRAGRRDVHIADEACSRTRPHGLKSSTRPRALTDLGGRAALSDAFYSGARLREIAARWHLEGSIGPTPRPLPQKRARRREPEGFSLNLTRFILGPSHMFFHVPALSSPRWSGNETTTRHITFRAAGRFGRGRMSPERREAAHSPAHRLSGRPRRPPSPLWRRRVGGRATALSPRGPCFRAAVPGRRQGSAASSRVQIRSSSLASPRRPLGRPRPRARALTRAPRITCARAGGEGWTVSSGARPVRAGEGELVGGGSTPRAPRSTSCASSAAADTNDGTSRSPPCGSTRKEVQINEGFRA